MGSVINPVTPVPSHQYGTRIRQNSLIKPSTRLRQVSEASTSNRKSKNNHVNKLHPVFPPPDVMLHPEDATSKVFLAVGRALTSVNNCALTIKDLAEMALNHGLGCQNASAAGQAITTYIRTHLQRCDAQQDHPLLLRHTLSGTSADDDLLPALHSRTGGAHCNANTENRVSSFRRGTMVWYLSKAAGAPCPFARVGIRICDYAESGKVGTDQDAELKNHGRDCHGPAEICGQKRKRLLRATSKSGWADENRRPSKVKLTLRLRPSLPVPASPSPEPLPSLCVDRSESEDVDTDGSMLSSEESSEGSSEDDVDTPADTSDATLWSLSSSYPKRSISCYTPLCDGPYPTFSTSSRHFAPQQKDPRQRSPSVPHSVASLPPDSEDEGDYPRSNAGGRQDCDQLFTPSRADDDWSPDFESEPELDTDGAQRESPDLHSPSARVGNGPVVKQEPTDLQSMLETWDNLNSNITDAKVIEMVAQAAASLQEPEAVKEEPPDDWNWDEPFISASPDWFPKTLGQETISAVKREDADLILSNLACVTSSVNTTDLELSSLSPLTPVSSISSSLSNFSFNFSSSVSAGSAPRRNSELMWKDAELLGPDSIHPEDMDNEWAEDRSSPAPKRAVVKPLIPPPSATKNPTLVARCLPKFPKHDSNTSSSSGSTQRPSNLSLSSPEAGAVVVHTCHPSDPPVSATQVEGISVYQMALGDSSLLRRIDTDFVFVSPVLRSLGIASLPPPLMANAVVIGEGSSAVVGTWVPLSSAQAFISENPAPKDWNTFLSDNLFERFPPALQEFHRSKEAAQLPDQFGPHFSSTLAAQRVRKLSGIGDFLKGGDGIWDQNLQADWSMEDLRAVPQYPLPLKRLTLDDVAVEEMPLSATEQEMFHELCFIPEWEKEKEKEKENVAVGPLADAAENSTTRRPQTRSSTTAEPLRRSKRVANANAAAALVPLTRSRTRNRNTRCQA